MGKSCLKFEKEFAKFHKSKFATLFNSGGSEFSNDSSFKESWYA